MDAAQIETGITDEAWEQLKVLLPPARSSTSSRGRPRKSDPRSIVDAIRYVLVRRCTWAELPKTFPQWKTAYSYYRQWMKDPNWSKIYRYLK